MATITSVSYLFRSTGGVVGVSVTSAIFQGLVKKILTERIKGPDAEKVHKHMLTPCVTNSNFFSDY